MTHHTDAERAEFEEFASVNGERPELVARNQAGEYQRLDTATGWMWWQAARRAQAAPVTQGLREAAQAVVERWDTPLWKDVPATTVYIADLRAALASAPQPPEAEAKVSQNHFNESPVQMPEPAGCVVYVNGESHHWDANRECAELFASSERSRGAPYAFTFENLYTEQQVRQLLAAKVKQGG